VKGQRTANELASEFGVQVSQNNTWKTHFLEDLPATVKNGIRILFRPGINKIRHKPNRTKGTRASK
jgi:hypothetical protein